MKNPRIIKTKDMTVLMVPEGSKDKYMKHKNNRKNNHKNNGTKNRDGSKCGVCPEFRAEKPNKGSDILAFPANTVIYIPHGKGGSP